MAHKFVEVGFAAAALDYRGCGDSEGMRGLTEDFLYLIEDYELFINETEVYLRKRFNEEKTKNVESSKFYMLIKLLT